MKRIAVVAMVLIANQSFAEKLSCREDPSNYEHFCYDKSKLVISGDLRIFQMYKGGPLGVDPTGYLAYIDCKVGYIEMRDRQGVAFARNFPTKPHIIQLRADVCAEREASKAKPRKKQVLIKDMPTPEHSAISVARKNGCFECHKVDEQYLAPSFTEIARRYRDAPPDRMAKNIRQGGSTQWGVTPKPPTPNLDVGESIELEIWILGLK